MITKEQALTSDIFHLGICTRHVGPRGGVTEKVTAYHRTSQTKTWKRDLEKFRVAVVHGMHRHSFITPDNAQHWHTEADCPLNRAPAQL